MDIEKIKEQLTKDLRKVLEEDFVGKPRVTEEQQEIWKRKAEEMLYEFHKEHGLPLCYEVNIKLED